MEGVHEEIDRHAERAGAEGGSRWVMGVALSAAILAGLAAVASLLSGHHANEALLHGNEATLRQAQASDAVRVGSSAGVSRRACANTVPSGSTTPPSTFVPPMSTPRVNPTVTRFLRSRFVGGGWGCHGGGVPGVVVLGVAVFGGCGPVRAILRRRSARPRHRAAPGPRP